MGKDFSKWWWENWTASCKSMKLEHTLTLCTEVNSKWLKRPKHNVRHHKTPGREYRQNILWHPSYKCFLRSVSQSNRNKSKNKPVGPNQMDKLLQSKGNQKENKKTTYRMGENSFKRCNWQGLNLQNIQTTHTTQQQQKTNNPIKKWAEDLNRHFSK